MDLEVQHKRVVRQLAEKTATAYEVWLTKQTLGGEMAIEERRDLVERLKRLEDEITTLTTEIKLINRAREWKSSMEWLETPGGYTMPIEPAAEPEEKPEEKTEEKPETPPEKRVTTRKPRQVRRATT